MALSVLLHGALLAALVYGWMLYRRPPSPRPAPTLAIDATVVDGRTVRGVLPGPQPAPSATAPQPEQPEQPDQGPPPPPQEATGPPQPMPNELAQREQQRQQEQAAAAQQAAAQQQADEQRRAATPAAGARKAQELAQAQKHADAQDKSEREADLKRSLTAEEQSSEAGAPSPAASPALDAWAAQISARINRAWLRPPTARAGIECVLDVTLVPGGEVTQVNIGQCTGDQAVKESIQMAVYRASPLPPPPNPGDFDGHLRITFRPN